MTPNVLLALRGRQFGEEETKTNMEDSDGKKKKKLVSKYTEIYNMSKLLWWNVTKK